MARLRSQPFDAIVDVPPSAEAAKWLSGTDFPTLTGREATLAAANALRELVGPVIARLSTASIDPGGLRATMSGVIARGLKGDFVDYAGAEQATMALSAVLDALRAARGVSEAQYGDLSKLLDRAYAAIEKDESYNPRQFLAALQAFEAAVPRS
jgi:hypothetical protein